MLLESCVCLCRPLLDSLTLSGSLQVSQTSADSIAISLLKQFSEKQLPKASELLWLVSERDAPQQVASHHHLHLFLYSFIFLC